MTLPQAQSFVRLTLAAAMAVTLVHCGDSDEAATGGGSGAGAARTGREEPAGTAGGQEPGREHAGRGGAFDEGRAGGEEAATGGRDEGGSDGGGAPGSEEGQAAGDSDGGELGSSGNAGSSQPGGGVGGAHEGSGGGGGESGAEVPGNGGGASGASEGGGAQPSGGGGASGTGSEAVGGGGLGGEPSSGGLAGESGAAGASGAGDASGGGGELADPSQILLDAKSSACLACGTSECNPNSAGTYYLQEGHTEGALELSCATATMLDGAPGSELCLDLLACILETECVDPPLDPTIPNGGGSVMGCYCGTADDVDPIDCLLAGEANGACKAEEEAALGVMNPAIIANNFGDTERAGGRANLLAMCLVSNCSLECFSGITGD